MDWNDPAARLALLEQAGVEGYSRQLAQHHQRTVIDVVCGHELRPVTTQFGRLIAVGDTGTAFRTLTEASRHAMAYPITIEPRSPSSP